MPAATHLLFCIAFIVIASTGCDSPSNAEPEQSVSSPKAQDWTGVYTSTKEVGAFTRTTLAIYYSEEIERYSYDMLFRTDVSMANDIPQDVLHGTCATTGDHVFIPQAHGYYINDEPRLHASVDRYTRREINGHVVLFRDDALRIFETSDKLYDYGILIQVKKTADTNTPLGIQPQESITALYDNADQGWEDPYLHGANPPTEGTEQLHEPEP